MNTSSKKMKLIISCFLTTVLLSFHCRAQKEGKDSLKLELIFQSGFEGTTKVLSEGDALDYGASYERIAGRDKTLKTKSNWDEDWKPVVASGNMQIQYTGGDSTKRHARIIADPTTPNNHVLHYWLNDSWAASEGQTKARIQTNIYGIKPGFKEFYQSVRVFLTEDFNFLKSYPQKINWCTLSEFWNNEWWVVGEPHGFRITLGVGKPTVAASDLNFILNAENTGQKEVWNADNTHIKVPVGKWFTMEYYFKEGNALTGRFSMAITPDGGKKQVVFDVHNFTHATNDSAPNGLTAYNPMKLYTAKDVVAFVKAQGKTLQVYWDDFKLWKNKRPE